MDDLVWTRRHLLGLPELSADEIRLILRQADAFQGQSTHSVRKVPALRGRVVVNAFFEDSTRTRMSFGLAAQRLSADVLEFTGRGSSVSKGETLRDTVQNIEAMGVDVMVVRHASAGAALHVSRAVRAGVVNAGDGAHQHPTQGLLDLYTVRQHFGREDGDFTGLRVAIVGDIRHSRVVRSTMTGLEKLGAEVVLVGPPTLVPGGLTGGRVSASHDFDEVVGEVDVIYMLRVQSERTSASGFPSAREFTRLFGLTDERFDRAKPNVLVMHPGPMNRGVEIAEAVADGPHSGVLQQVEHGLAVRMAVLFLVSQANEAARREERGDD
jgi:aspartate carbamoyltransferase catalytic subunit